MCCGVHSVAECTDLCSCNVLWCAQCSRVYRSTIFPVMCCGVHRVAEYTDLFPVMCCGVQSVAECTDLQYFL